jgi:hypothetical protein
MDTHFQRSWDMNVLVIVKPEFICQDQACEFGFFVYFIVSSG